jgi:predicted 3-demethylubiquinone-9 3-methyltransferase (glyoxalase superfamily)
MQKITPFIWFEKNMKEITDFYTSVFPLSTVKSVGELSDTPSGNVEMATLTIYGQSFSLMTAGPMYRFTPAVSFIINCDTNEEADELWGKLTREGKTLMPMDSYPFADKYGWVMDRYGVSWQIMCIKGEKPKEKITPTFMFAGKMCGICGMNWESQSSAYILMDFLYSSTSSFDRLFALKNGIL